MVIKRPSKQDKLFGDRIRELRKAKNMTMESLAHKAGIDVSYLGYVERGQQAPTVRKIWRIARSLGVEPSELFYFKDSKSYQKQFDILKDRLVGAIAAKDTKAATLLDMFITDLKKTYLQ